VCVCGRVCGCVCGRVCVWLCLAVRGCVYTHVSVSAAALARSGTTSRRWRPTHALRLHVTLTHHTPSVSRLTPRHARRPHSAVLKQAAECRRQLVGRGHRRHHGRVGVLPAGHHTAAHAGVRARVRASLCVRVTWAAGHAGAIFFLPPPKLHTVAHTHTHCSSHASHTR
jgi:hypothetical protein